MEKYGKANMERGGTIKFLSGDFRNALTLDGVSPHFICNNFILS